MLILFQYFWALAIAVNIFNYFATQKRLQKYIDEDPSREEGYKMVLKALFIYGNIPFVIMGIGQLGRSTQMIWDYFNPRGGNPFVLTFHASIVTLWILSLWWMYFRGGAEFLTKHPGIVRWSGFGKSGDITSANSIKLIFGLCLLGGAAGMFMMWFMGPKFPSLPPSP